MSASNPFPPATVSPSYLGASLPTYTPTGVIHTLPGPTFTAAPKASVGSGWNNPADKELAYVYVSSIVFESCRLNFSHTLQPGQRLSVSQVRNIQLSDNHATILTLVCFQCMGCDKRCSPSYDLCLNSTSISRPSHAHSRTCDNSNRNFIYALMCCVPIYAFSDTRILDLDVLFGRFHIVFPLYIYFICFAYR